MYGFDEIERHLVAHSSTLLCFVLVKREPTAFLFFHPFLITILLEFPYDCPYTRLNIMQCDELNN